ncbi:hypothetical protein SUGI_1097660 [Cryptomeria japonica]|nr:hypothetical protein SUGI_1097660 [Cryptomeria japonica]
MVFHHHFRAYKTLIPYTASTHPQQTVKSLKIPHKVYQNFSRHLTEAAMADIALILTDDYHRNHAATTTTVYVHKPSYNLTEKLVFCHDFVLQAPHLSKKFLEKIAEPRSLFHTAITEGFSSA